MGLVGRMDDPLTRPERLRELLQRPQEPRQCHSSDCTFTRPGRSRLMPRHGSASSARRLAAKCLLTLSPIATSRRSPRACTTRRARRRSPACAEEGGFQDRWIPGDELVRHRIELDRNRVALYRKDDMQQDLAKRPHTAGGARNGKARRTMHKLPQ